MYYIDIGTEVAALNSQFVPISQVVLKTGFTVLDGSMVTGLHCKLTLTVTALM